MISFLTLIPGTVKAPLFQGCEYKKIVKVVKKPPVKRNVVAREARKYVVRISNGYYRGQCTFYAAIRRPDLPRNLGNAREWLYNARIQGIKTGRTPRVGAVVSLSESYWGHVAYTEKIENGQIYVSEMNVRGVGVKSYRWIPINSYKIRGYIY